MGKKFNFYKIIYFTIIKILNIIYNNKILSVLNFVGIIATKYLSYYYLLRDVNTSKIFSSN